MKLIKGTTNRFIKSTPAKEFASFTKEKVDGVYQFHTSMPVYEETPLHSLKGLSDYLGVQNVFVKDESKRFGLNAFKGLGVSYAVADYYAKQLNIHLHEVDFNELIQLTKQLPQVTFTTATDGNHGKSLAWAAQLFGQPAKIFMPKGSSPSRLEAIRSFGAEATETDLNYDDTVQMVAEMAKQHNWVVIQDTAWEGYEEIPLAIMQGYSTIVLETMNQLSKQSFHEITHVFLQAGVGSFASAIASTITSLAEGTPPKIIIVEPEQADCLYQSALDDSGQPKRVYGDLNTIMAGLACGDPNPIAWNLLKTTVHHFFSCGDEIAAKGMRVLGNPIGTDARIIAGESGAAPLGFVYEVMNNPELVTTRQDLNLGKDSNVLVINTEGDTDPDSYRKIVWN
jgi:diaminopropionate ammonia-lyase